MKFLVHGFGAAILCLCISACQTPGGIGGNGNTGAEAAPDPQSTATNHQTQQSPGNSPSSLSPADADAIAQIAAENALADIQNNSQAIPPIPNADNGIALPVQAGGPFYAQANCTIQSMSGEAPKADILYIYNCPNVRGTIEVNELGLGSYDITNKLIFMDGKNGNNAGINSAYAIDKAASGSVTISKTFDDAFVFNGANYAMKGKANYEFTPDGSTGFIKTGEVRINSSTAYFKDGAQIATFSASSNGLHRALCGFDRGTLELKDAKNTIVITFTACGQKNIMNNGAAIR